MNYDPNIRWANQTVLLRLQSWDYIGTAEVTIGGNCKGANILQSAMDQWLEETYEVVLSKETEEEIETLLVEDDLEALIVGAEIIKIEKDEK